MGCKRNAFFGVEFGAKAIGSTLVHPNYGQERADSNTTQLTVITKVLRAPKQ